MAENGMTQPKQDMALLQKDITDSVMNRLNDLKDKQGLTLPPGYNASTALRSAWLKLLEVEDKDHHKALEVCTKPSVANALFDMCIQGLSPARTQCYFIVYGNQLRLSRSYFGTLAALKRVKGVSDVFAQVIYQDDVFDYEINGGNVQITKHEQKLANRDETKIVGAYCTIVKDGLDRSEIMTIKQIRQAWTHRKNNGQVQNEFPDQMAMRTVINRAAKMYVNTATSDDEVLDSIARTTADEHDAQYDMDDDSTPEQIRIPESTKELPGTLEPTQNHRAEPDF